MSAGKSSNFFEPRLRVAQLNDEDMADHALQVLTELLVLRAQGGETDAFELLVRAWQDRLLRHAQRLTRNQQAGCDVMQDAWMGIMRGLHRLDDPASFGPWAYRIVTIQSVRWIRLRQRRGQVEVEAAIPADSPGPSTESAEQVDEVRTALRGLPPEQQAILELRYVEEFSVARIAQALGMAAGTVKSRLFHAREHLRAILERIRK